jgi:ATP-dependent Clp protease ATP-binding subunit ClpB
VLGELASVGFDPVFGARPLKRAIQHMIGNPLAREILEGRFAAKDTIRATLTGGRISFTRVVSSEAPRAAAQ